MLLWCGFCLVLLPLRCHCYEYCDHLFSFIFSIYFRSDDDEPLPTFGDKVYDDLLRRWVFFFRNFPLFNTYLFVWLVFIVFSLTKFKSCLLNVCYKLPDKSEFFRIFFCYWLIAFFFFFLNYTLFYSCWNLERPKELLVPRIKLCYSNICNSYHLRILLACKTKFMMP